MDAVFVIDQDYPTFQEAWADLHKTLGSTGIETAPRIESFRVTLSGENEPKDLAPTTELGWHYRGPTSKAYLKALEAQLEALLRQKISFKVMSQPFGKAQLNELRSFEGQAPFIAIPFEDTAKNLPRFFGRFAEPLRDVLRLSKGRMENTLAAFYDHAVNHLADGAAFRPTDGGLEWIARRGMVGRHELLQEIEIRHVKADVSVLVDLFAKIEQLSSPEPIQLYLQFFSSPDRLPEIAIPTSFLYERTFQYAVPSIPSADRLVSQAQGVSDVFVVLDQVAGGLANHREATYTIRRTRAGHFEIRVNMGWDDDAIDPEAAVAGIEKQSGLTWARLI